MTLSEYFVLQCKETAENLHCHSFGFKNFKDSKKSTSTACFFSFESFKFYISYYENGGSTAPQQTLWVDFVLDCDKSIPFSIYDILAFIEPQNFNCYNFSYVDSIELMEDCFGELNGVLERIIPKLSAFLNDGIQKNKLLTSQKESLNKFFGDNVLESGEMIGPAADKLINMMIKTFHDSQLESASTGAQSLFYSGKDEKALKKLKKSKYKNIYQLNLIKYLENGGTSGSVSSIAKKASMTKGVLRHGGGIKGGLKLIGLSFLFNIPISLILMGLFYIICKFAFKGSVLFMGFYENIIVLMFFGFPLAAALAYRFIKYNRANAKETSVSVQSPKSTAFSGNMLKYLTIAAETLALLGCFTSVNSTAVFYNDYLKYSQSDFPLSQSTCKYSAIDFIGIIESNNDNITEKESYIVIKTKSGITLDLYNSTWLSAEDFAKHTDFLKEKGIEIKHFKSYDEYSSK